MPSPSIRRVGACAALIVAAACLSPPASGLDIAPLRHPVGSSVPHAYVPFAASHSLSHPNPKITRILFSIHSSNFDALAYYDNAAAAASKVGALPETLIVAPQFFDQDVIPGEIPDGMVYWRESPFRGSSRAAVGGHAAKVRISAYDVMDDWLGSLADRRLFPHLRDIVIVGHSGGGQFVQRYALAGKFEPPAGVGLRFVVSAPSSYAYLTGERYNPHSKAFENLPPTVRAQCPTYDEWGYGMQAPYSYLADVAADTLVRRYATRHVFYLCGSKDDDPAHKTLATSCPAMLQGRHRLERMQVFANHLERVYGAAIRRTRHFAVVPGVGHRGRATMTSAAGLEALFAPLP